MLGFFCFSNFMFQVIPIMSMASDDIESFMEYMRAEIRASEKTIDAYGLELSRWEDFLNHEFDISTNEAEKGNVKRFIVWRNKSGISNRSINRSLSALRSYYKWCEKSNRHTNQPVHGIRSLKTAKRLVMSIPEQDLESLTKDDLFNSDFEGMRNQLILLLLYGLGLRRAELIELKESDFDWSRGAVTIIGKRNKERQVPLPIVIEEYFNSYHQARNHLQSDAHHLLLTRKGKKLYPSLVYNIVLSYLNDATTVVDKHPHTLRHSYATHLLNAGVDINTVKELMGHESLSSTQVYTTSTFEELVKVYNRAHPKGS